MADKAVSVYQVLAHRQQQVQKPVELKFVLELSQEAKHQFLSNPQFCFCLGTEYRYETSKELKETF